MNSHTEFQTAVFVEVRQRMTLKNRATALELMTFENIENGVAMVTREMPSQQVL